MARALLVADSLLTATIDNDAPETLPGQTSDDTLTSASEPHRAHGHGLDLPRLHAEKSMLKQEFVTETMPAQPRADAAHASGQAQEQVHAPSHDSAEPIADSAHVVADSLLHRNLLIDMGYGPDDEVGRPGDGNSNVDSNEESDDEHDGGDAAAQLRATALARRHQQLQEQAQQHAQQQTQLRTQQQEAGPGASGAKRERGERGGRKRKKKPGEKQARNEMAAGSTSGSTITATFALTQDAALREHAASVAGLSGEPKRHALRALELMSDTRARLLLAIEGASGRDEAEAFDSIAYVMRSAAGALQRRAGCIEQAKSDTLYRRERADVRHAQHDARQGQRGSAATHAGHASSSGDAGCGGKGGGGKDGGSKGGSSNDSGYPAKETRLWRRTQRTAWSSMATRMVHITTAERAAAIRGPAARADIIHLRRHRLRAHRRHRLAVTTRKMARKTARGTSATTAPRTKAASRCLQYCHSARLPWPRKRNREHRSNAQSGQRA